MREPQNDHATKRRCATEAHIITLILVCAGAATAAARSQAAKTPPPKTSPKGFTIHKRTPYFIDIEAPVDQVWVGCPDDGPTPDAISGVMFYALDGDTAYEFYFRHVYDVRTCLELERKYRKMMRGAKTVRLVGCCPTEPDIGPQPARNERTPRRFTTATTMTIPYVFVRMQAGSRCRAYFLEDCELPKNYWGGTIPEQAVDTK